MTFSTTDIPDLTGKVAIVTGGNTGLGYETVKALASKNAKVYLAARIPEKADSAITSLKESIPDAKIEFLELNLADLKQVKSAAEKFKSSGERLDILVNNAGIMACPFELSKDGIESQFATNHLGHFLFTTTLLPVIERSAPSRIVNLSSEAHRLAPKDGILFEKINDESAMSNWVRYGQSKLANILFTKSLVERLEGKDIHVNAVHPGVVNTELSRGPLADAEKNPSFVGRLYKFVHHYFASTILYTPPQGALNQLYAATSPEIVAKNLQGQYFVPFGKISKPIPQAESKELRDKLWAFSEKIVNEKTA